ncbi:hypothetical protein B0H13DRAFT_2281278 [Mycena leptocephala]|nr:hypothetical protein B0H13DRAFT_2281278 [Mycena leptocephala]
MAPAVDFLRLRIHELSLAIKHQTEVLDNLAKARSDAQRELNSILDPMTWLPLEISSDIFMRCLPDIPRTHADAAPMLFLHVCHAWTNIALSTPPLWNKVQVECPGRADLPDGMSIWFCRARHLPLTLSVEGGSVDRHVQDLVEVHAHRFQNLYFRSGVQLERMMTSQFTSLTKLGIRRDHSQREGLHAPHSLCLQMLYSAPNLVECTFENIWDTFNPPTQRSTLLSLKNLRLEYSSSSILHHLNLPSLESFHISETFRHISLDPLLTLTTRSQPQLQSLSLSGRCHTNMVDPCLLLPSLSYLAFTAQTWPSDFFRYLGASSGRVFLPNIRELEIHLIELYIPPDGYQALLGALSSRRASPQSGMNSFRLYLISDDITPNPNIIVSLQALVADGMDIYIGKMDKENLI